MALGDKPTFDPYSIGDFSLRDVFRSGVRSWKHRRWAFLAFATFACLPSLSAYLLSSPWLNLLFAAMAVIILLAVISPIVARTSRGLSAEIRSTLEQLGRQAVSLAVSGLIVSTVIALPGLALLPIGLTWAYLGLAVGIILGVPLVFAIPVVMVETMNPLEAIKRSLFLVKGRRKKTYPSLTLLVLSAVVPAALQFTHPEWAAFTLFVQPVLLCVSAVGVGALYVNLYQN